MSRKNQIKTPRNIGIAKMQADGSYVSTVVTPLSCISGLTLSIYLCTYYHLFYLCLPPACR